jgi:hypothetical protein
MNRYYYEIISQSMKTELEHAGFSVVFLPQDRDSPNGGSGAAAPTQEQLIRLGSRFDVDYLIFSIFSVEENQAQLQFLWYDVVRSRLAATVSQTGTVDLSFDRTVAGAIEEILLKSGANPLPEQQSSQAMVHAVEPDHESSKASKRLELAVGFSAFLVNGSASDYFKIGFMPSICADFLLPLPRSYLALGLYGGANLFTAQGSLATSDSALIPIALSLRYGFGIDLPIGVFLRLAGGPALLTIDPNEAGRLWKLVPYASAGLGMDVRFAGVLGIKVETAYSVFVERRIWIYGFAPSFYLYLRL